ncbi:MAG: hypothetical protein HC907_09320 [Richelia sp. SM1_7_0]|nr:hypothetical protein [Richelia sp. SM2_1_7]NJM18888.1 hypothetical protein [Richelia sp. SM1_7_0]
MQFSFTHGNTNLTNFIFGTISRLGFLNDLNYQLERPSSFDIINSPRGETQVAFSSDLTNALSSLNVEVEGFGSTDIELGVADFRITGGAADIDTGKVDIIHDGGLTLKAGEATVNLTDFIVTNLDNNPVITGAVIVNDDLVTRAPLFDLQIGSLGTSNLAGNPILNIDNIQATLTNDAANLLNQAFGVSAFTQGLDIGTAEVEALLR